ncbi:MAG: polymorphic toxin type 23 domain-containing protein [Brumimicrobium sp.]
MKRFWISILFLVQFITIKAQTLQEDDWGLQIGISANFGTHINQLGLKIQGYFRYEFVQINGGNLFLFNASNLADRKNYFETRINLGSVLLAGRRNSVPTFIFDGLNHQSDYEYGLGYNYLWYLDDAKSSQVSGGFGFHVRQFSLLVENDIFSGNGRDRFRTSYTQLNYHNELINITLNTQLWTGETWGTKLQEDHKEKHPVGYKDLRNTIYGKKSHGILSVGADYNLYYGNSVSVLIGIDDERIRNGLQNRFMHNKPFLPKKWRTQNVHYPMLDYRGLPTHSKEDTKMSKLFLQFGQNRPVTY